MDWGQLGLFISLVTPLLLGVGAWINDAITKKKKKSRDVHVPQGLAIDYETDYINLLKRRVSELTQENKELKRENKQLRKENNG